MQHSLGLTKKTLIVERLREAIDAKVGANSYLKSNQMIDNASNWTITGKGSANPSPKATHGSYLERRD